MKDNSKIPLAIRYASMGLYIFPVHSIVENKCTCGNKDCKSAGKHPKTKNGFNGATTDKKEIARYWNKNPDSNIGCATGAVSNILVLDFDTKHGKSVQEMLKEMSSKGFNIPPTVFSKTGEYSGERGCHMFFSYPNVPIKSTTNIFKDYGIEGVDVRADGGYVVVPPSSHHSGVLYEWAVEPEGQKNVSNLEPTPEWLIKLLTEERTGVKLYQKDPNEITVGSRNEAAASMAGKIRYSLPVDTRDTLGWEKFKDWNSKMIKPLSLSELASVWKSISKYPVKERQGKSEEKKKDISPVEKLLADLLGREDVKLFHDEQDNAYISLNIDEKYQTLSCKSKAIKKWISNEFWRTQEKVPTQEVVKSAISVLEGKASYEGPEHKLTNRIAWYEKELWYDLTNKEWQAVKISKSGWEIVNKQPPIFRRYSHNKAQVLPEKGGDARLFLKYVNIKNEEHKVLLIVHLVSCFVPDFPHALLIIFGSQGSAKTTQSKLERAVIDPSVIEVASMPDNQKELIQTLAHHYFLFFDNISYISETTSDTLCKAVTGGGFPKRELYSDDDDVIYSFMRCIGMNGINLVATRADLLERSLLIELERIEPSERKQEKEILNSFQADLPFILGGIFDTLVKALEIQPTIKVEKLPRMADFAIWGCAIAEALGYTKEQFLSAYNNNIKKQTETVLNENIVATAIMSFMDEVNEFDLKGNGQKEEWRGTATALLKELTNHISNGSNYAYEKYWPKSASKLVQRLNEIKPNLKEAGILFSTFQHKERGILLKKVPINIVTDDIS